MDDASSPFHSGEIEAQARAGLDTRPRGAGIRDFMPDQHREFFALLPYIFIATPDDEGVPVPAILEGPAGFVTSPDPRLLDIARGPDPDDPIARHLRPGAPIGLLGLDLGTRRRNRANGSLLPAGNGGMAIAVEQSFGNCPQYIQVRDVEWAAGVPSGSPLERLARVDAGARDQIAAADTFFVASRSASLAASERGGVDISHRGGRPGFVRVENDTLTIPDFRGNRYFNTLGNLIADPRAALLFVDFDRGDLLVVQGRTEILWDGDSEEVRSFVGAERLWRLHVTGGWRRRGALRLRWRFREFAPTTEKTGSWR